MSDQMRLVHGERVRLDDVSNIVPDDMLAAMIEGAHSGIKKAPLPPKQAPKVGAIPHRIIGYLRSPQRVQGWALASIAFIAVASSTLLVARTFPPTFEDNRPAFVEQTTPQAADAEIDAQPAEIVLAEAIPLVNDVTIVYASADVTYGAADQFDATGVMPWFLLGASGETVDISDDAPPDLLIGPAGIP